MLIGVAYVFEDDGVVSMLEGGEVFLLGVEGIGLSPAIVVVYRESTRHEGQSLQRLSWWHW